MVLTRFHKNGPNGLKLEKGTKSYPYVATQGLEFKKFELQASHSIYQIYWDKSLYFPP
jgi:hypothetical protein